MRKILALMLLAVPAFGQTGEITPLIGFQSGGAIRIAGESAPLDVAPAFGVMLSFDRGRGRKLDFLVVGQQTQGEVQDPFVPPVTVGLGVTYFQFGGRAVIHPDATTRPYVALTLGGTYLNAGGADALQPSGAAGGGVDIELTPKVALRFDGRFHATLFATAGAFSCDGGGTCSTSTTGGLFVQFTGMTGLVFRF